MRNTNKYQILYSQHLAKFGSKEALVKAHEAFLEDYRNGKEPRTANSEIKARLLTRVLEIANGKN
jgi:hypothetical protein